MVFIQHPYDGSVVTLPTGNTFYPGIVHSTSLNLNIGVPQGSILRLLLFLIYINDIVNTGNVLPFVLFADDKTVNVQNDSIDSAIEILNTEFTKVALWFDSNKLTSM